MRVLAGDIGGTKTELALFELDGDVARELRAERFPSKGARGLSELTGAFLGAERVAAAAFAVAGPVRDGRCRTTNLPWALDEGSLSSELGARTRLLNDFAAVVHGVGTLSAADLHVLARGERDPDGPIAVIGAGTGLGEAIGVPEPGGLRVLPTEGGHADLAPRNEVEQRLLAFLRARHPNHVSVERAVSGPGLHALYDFVVDAGLAPESAAVRTRPQASDPSEVIGELGAAGSDAACTSALDLFVRLYGAEAGNLALKTLPTGGLFVAGGIAPKLRERLARGDFLEALLDKGRMRPVLERLPVAIVMQPRVGLLGACAVAQQLAARR